MADIMYLCPKREAKMFSYQQKRSSQNQDNAEIIRSMLISSASVTTLTVISKEWMELES
jgi:hypothetical protein